MARILHEIYAFENGVYARFTLERRNQLIEIFCKTEDNNSDRRI